MQRRLTGTSVILLWGAFNTILAAILAGFTASATTGGAGPAGALAFAIYGSSATLVFLIALAAWASRRRPHGPAAPPRPATAVLLAAAIAIAWTGLALGPWAAYVAAAPAVAAIVHEFYPRTQP